MKSLRRERRKAIGYTLYSNQAERERAEQSIRAYCEATTLNLLEVLAEDRNAVRRKNFIERPAGETIVRSWKAQGVRHLVIIKLADAFTGASDLAVTAGKFQRRRRHLHVLDLGGIPTTTESDTTGVFWRLALALGGMEKHNTRHRLARGEEHGEVVGYIEGSTPYGYERRGSLLVKNEGEQRVISQMRALKASGWSLHAIAGRLNDDKVKTKVQGRWYASTVQRALQSHRASVGSDLWRPEDDHRRLEMQLDEEARHRAEPKTRTARYAAAKRHRA